MSDDPAGGEPDPTEVLAAYWAEGERRLYPLATVDADAYMEAVKLVRAVADELAGVTTLDELAERWDRRSELMSEAKRASDARPGSLAGSLVGETEAAGAGFALRRRELLAERSESRRREAVAAARRAGRAWAVLHERGDPAAGLADPYQCMELHLATGLAVVSTVEPDPSTMAPNHVVSVAAAGDENGRTADLDPASFEDLETADPEQFQRNRQAMRRLVETAEE